MTATAVTITHAPMLPTPLPNDHPILINHAHELQAIEDDILYAIGNRYGTASSRQAIRKHLERVIPWVLNTQQRIDDLTQGELLRELRLGDGSVYAPLLVDKISAECPRCDRAVSIDREGICPECTHEFQEVD